MRLIMEWHDGQQWRHLATLTPESAEGSISASGLLGDRDVILFRCLGDHSRVRRSIGGFDTADGPARVVTPLLGFEELAVLRAGECHELTAITDRGIPYTVRWRHED